MSSFVGNKVFVCTVASVSVLMAARSLGYVEDIKVALACSIIMGIVCGSVWSHMEVNSYGKEYLQKEGFSIPDWMCGKNKKKDKGGNRVKKVSGDVLGGIEDMEDIEYSDKPRFVSQVDAFAANDGGNFEARSTKSVLQKRHMFDLRGTPAPRNLDGLGDLDIFNMPVEAAHYVDESRGGSF